MKTTFTTYSWNMQTEAVDLKKNTQNTTTKRISTHCEIVKQVRPPSIALSALLLSFLSLLQYNQVFLSINNAKSAIFLPTVFHVYPLHLLISFHSTDNRWITFKNLPSFSSHNNLAKIFFQKNWYSFLHSGRIRKWRFKLKSITFIDFLLFNLKSNCLLLKSIYTKLRLIFFHMWPKHLDFPSIKRLNFWVTYEKRVDLRT